MSKQKYSLVGVDGNAYCIMGYTADTMQQTGFTQEEIDKMYEEAESGNYSHLIGVCNKYIYECNKRLGGK